MSKKSQLFWVVCLVLFCMNVGFFAGSRSRLRRPQLKILRSEQNKINEALEVISRYYVDSVDIKNLSESAVEKIISELDPHSSYIPASEVETANEGLEASFGGIGIQFNMVTDTIVVIEIIPGGPAEKAGLQTFDRILMVNDTLVAGQKINQNKMLRMLRGPKGSKVMLGVQRGNADELIQFELTRGDIPNYSIDVSYKVKDNIGYINITKFARSTYSEFLNAIAKLKQEGVTGYIIDLRGNPGGYMDAAVYIMNEFLQRGSLIVFSQGQFSPRQNYHANGKGACQDAPVVVLIDERSGSASEIFSGAVQDNDRGLLIGRRSFGKGLVQSKFDLSDQSELLLTIARYYTPSGRCIQKEYELGKSDEYNMDYYNRWMHGEFYSADSIKMNESLEFKTVGGRIVYGGGGIMPDIFVPQDTSGHTSYLAQLSNTNVLYQFALDYSDKKQDILNTFNNYLALYEYLKRQPLLEELADYAEVKGIRKRPTLMDISKNLIETWLHSYIVRNFFGNDGFYPIFYKDDPALLKAVEVIEKNIWKPEHYFQFIEINTDENMQSSAYVSRNDMFKHLYIAVC